MASEQGRHLTELRRRARRNNKPKSRHSRAKDKRESKNALRKGDGH
jgi:hypothetical protein